MTARTPRTTREEREGLREAAEDGIAAGANAPGTDWGPLRVALQPTCVTVHALLADLRDAEAERDAAVERAERAEAAVGRGKGEAISAMVVSLQASIAVARNLSDDAERGVFWQSWANTLLDALDHATDAETGRGGAGRGSAEVADVSWTHEAAEPDWVEHEATCIKCGATSDPVDDEGLAAWLSDHGACRIRSRRVFMPINHQGDA